VVSHMRITVGKPSWMIVLLFSMNVAFWVCFWVYFFTHPASPSQAIWEGGAPWAKVLGRSFGDGVSLVSSVLNVPVIRVATVIFLPCFFLTWPIPQWVPIGFEFAGSDAQGIRLVLITLLSFAQWVVVARMWCALRLRLANRRQR
jgi:hypothetical protein